MLAVHILLPTHGCILVFALEALSSRLCGSQSCQESCACWCAAL